MRTRFTLNAVRHDGRDGVKNPAIGNSILTHESAK